MEKRNFEEYLDKIKQKIELCRVGKEFSIKFEKEFNKFKEEQERKDNGMGFDIDNYEEIYVYFLREYFEGNDTPHIDMRYHFMNNMVGLELKRNNDFINFINKYFINDYFKNEEYIKEFINIYDFRFINFNLIHGWLLSKSDEELQEIISKYDSVSYINSPFEVCKMLRDTFGGSIYEMEEELIELESVISTILNYKKIESLTSDKIKEICINILEDNLLEVKNKIKKLDENKDNGNCLVDDYQYNNLKKQKKELETELEKIEKGTVESRKSWLNKRLINVNNSNKPLLFNNEEEDTIKLEELNRLNKRKIELEEQIQIIKEYFRLVQEINNLNRVEKQNLKKECEKFNKMNFLERHGKNGREMALNLKSKSGELDSRIEQLEIELENYQKLFDNLIKIYNQKTINVLINIINNEIKQIIKANIIYNLKQNNLNYSDDIIDKAIEITGGENINYILAGGDKLNDDEFEQIIKTTKKR